MSKLFYLGWANSSVPHLEKTCKNPGVKRKTHGSHLFHRKSFIMCVNSQKHKALQPKAEALEMRLVIVTMINNGSHLLDTSVTPDLLR